MSEIETRKEELTEHLLKVAREHLDRSEIETSQEAIAKGLLPVAADKEETKNDVPVCCSLEFTTKS